MVLHVLLRFYCDFTITVIVFLLTPGWWVGRNNVLYPLLHWLAQQTDATLQDLLLHLHRTSFGTLEEMVWPAEQTAEKKEVSWHDHDVSDCKELIIEDQSENSRVISGGMTLFFYGFSMSLFYGFTMFFFLLGFYGFTLVCLMFFSYGSTMVLLWFYYGFTIVVLWFFFGFTLVLLWFKDVFFYVSTMVLLWCCYFFTMALLWWYYCCSMVLLWLYYGFTMVVRFF